MNIFEQASREQFRFASQKGMLSTEQLWELPLTSKSGFDLDSVAKTVNMDLKETSEESFVSVKSNPARKTLEVKLEVVKYIIAAKLEANEKARNNLARAQERERLTDILANKQDEALQGLSVEEIQKRIDALGN